MKDIPREDVGGPPTKKIKFGQEFIELVEDCYETLFNKEQKTEKDQARLEENIDKICRIIEQVQSSTDVEFGPTRLKSKITWSKCLYLLLEYGCPRSLHALDTLNSKLTPGYGML